MDRAEFEDWLKDQSRAHCVLIASRAALRVLPFACKVDQRWNSKTLALFTLRAILTSGVAGTIPTPKVSAAVDAASAAGRAAYAAYAAGRAASAAAHSASAAAHSADAAARSADAAYAAAHSAGAADAAYASAFKDTEYTLEELMLQPIWLSSEEPLFLEIWRDEADNHLDEPAFSFWSEWYRGFLVGRPMDWELQKRIALIEDKIWEAGAEAVAEEIERIRAKHAVDQALADLSENPETSTQSRHTIGGNNPPEAIEVVEQLQQSVTLIWAGIEAVEEEAEAESPDKGRVERALEMLKSGLAGLLRWSGKKADLAINTLIISGVSIGVTRLAANPEKVSALIEAVKNWLPFI